MKLFRVEVVGTWDVKAESKDEAIEKLVMLLPPRETDTGISQSDVKVAVLESEDLEES